MDELTVLRLGDNAPLAELLQLALTRAGCALAIDGVFGAETDGAVRRFQASRGLTPDGIVGENTWSVLTTYLVGYIIYSVEPNDTVYALAREYGTTADAVAAANPGLDPARLTPGQILTIPLWFDIVPSNIRATPTVLYFCIEGLTARYPFLGTGSVGRSIMGRDIPYIAIGGGERAVSYNAAHHANEWITTPLLLTFLETYAKALVYGGGLYGVDARAIYGAATLYIVPMVNPDGVALVTGALASGEEFENARRIAAAFPDVPFPSGWKANIAGTDPNLQYPAGWENARELKFAQGFTQPAPRDFVGSAPLSAPESRAMYDFTLARDFALTLSYHTQGEVIYWKYLDYEPPGSRALAESFSAASGYAAEETPYGSGFAGYKDWFIERFNRPGYTIEAGTGASPVPLTQFPAIFRKNLGVLTLGLTAAGGIVSETR